MARASLARANAAIGDWFGRLPKAPCEVVVMPAHEEKHSTIAYYREPAADGSRPGQYYINTYAPETRPRYEAETLAFHESVPGHHLQLAIMQELTELPAFRRFNGSTAYIEGWGLYTERLSEEMGLLSSEIDRFGVLSFDAWRAARLVVDTGMHALGWTRQQAIDFMVEHTALGENNIANEVDRYISYAGPGAGLQARPARAPAAARRGARAPGGSLRHPALPRRRPRAGRPAAARPARGRRAHAHLGPMVERRDPYRILQVQPDADPDVMTRGLPRARAQAPSRRRRPARRGRRDAA